MFLDVLQTLGASGSGDSGAPEDIEVVRRLFNRTTSRWNTRRRFASSTATQSFPFLVARQSYTIGATGNTPTPNFIVSRGNAPQSILYANLVETDVSPAVLIPMNVINIDQYELVSIPALTSRFPTTLYYVRPGNGTLNGTIFPWPAYPTAILYELSLSWWAQFEDIPASDITTPILLADGYEEALVLTVAEKAYLKFPKRTDFNELKIQARTARADAQSNNVPPPVIGLADGLQDDRYDGFNWQTRLPG